ncbi:MAG: hypothetical protein CM15mP74_27300 [Halieaceae bacterium]|nr:MAG: hypothetical protein CM15mP74_27300 [Halieaceae bacterium]
MLDYQKAISDAEEKCTKNGIDSPSAEAGSQCCSKPTPPYRLMKSRNSAMSIATPKCQQFSVYRILDLLQEQNLIPGGKLPTNMFPAHISCSHEHNKSKFLICGGCRHFEEIYLSHDAVDALQTAASAAGFSAISSQLEITGWCARASRVKSKISYGQ